MQDLIGKQIGQYEITGIIGKGGMGVVYHARDTKLQRDVAVKVLSLDTAQNDEMRKRFMREANAAARLNHPSIIDVYTLDTQDKLYYIAMRYVEGLTLSQLIRQQGPLPLTRTAHIIEQLSSALDYAHQHEIIHRDIKPANIIVGQDDRVTLMDFGIAKAPSKESLTRVGQVMGTIEYMSPEQFRGRPVDARTDIYSLGVILYQMVTGTLPFSSQALLSDPTIFGAPPSPRQHNPQISVALETVILRGLAEYPDGRYSTAMELTNALRSALNLNQPSAVPEPSPDAGLPEPLKLVFPNGYEQTLQLGVLRLGRSPDSDIILKDDRVSRYHAEIHCKALHGCAIVDLGSANGTFINGRALKPKVYVPLKEGMSINFGAKVSIKIQRGIQSAPSPVSPLADPGSLDTTRQDRKNGAADNPPSLLSHPTRVIAKAAAQLDNRKIIAGVAGLVILAVVGVWFGAPLWRDIAFVWQNIPLIGLVGALVYAALHRPWVAAIAHTLVALGGGWVLWQRLGIYGDRYGTLLLSAIVSGLFIRAWLIFLPGRDRREEKSPWYEAGGLAMMSTLAVAILYGMVNITELLRVGQWFGAAFMGMSGWFLGDTVHQYLHFRGQK